MYIYQKADWPNFTWDREQIYQSLLAVKFEQGKLQGQIQNLGFERKKNAVLEALTSEVVKTSEIDGSNPQSCDSPFLVCHIASV